ncbi:hypothetical protein LX16_4107 [Stackebrandtia albiflava]|uniref:Uncharacterized protein n=1 Tax=Stackebrandtia albiflava TaxID=406432 RepID=A0A562UYL1_9ACTN|nr:hypothetical protein LX16_4107 [Stackebrandtia albiflava]
MQSVTLPYALIVALIATVVTLTVAAAALCVQHGSARRAVDLSPPSPHTPRSDCPRSGCTIVHPRVGRHRRRPEPAGPVEVVASVIACGFGLFAGRGRHYR